MKISPQILPTLYIHTKSSFIFWYQENLINKNRIVLWHWGIKPTIILLLWLLETGPEQSWVLVLHKAYTAYLAALRPPRVQLHYQQDSP